uniref:Uncharacterized protein n=1 Tax=Timema douglasi TaxID=61478 RepID=A0A7R8ZFH3_TIMDO|nr:unnamed protein product [Timema douglasi]
MLKYSIPTASLVLTDSSQLTSNSQHLELNEFTFSVTEGVPVGWEVTFGDTIEGSKEAFPGMVALMVDVCVVVVFSERFRMFARLRSGGGDWANEQRRARIMHRTDHISDTAGII